MSSSIKYPPLFCKNYPPLLWSVQLFGLGEPPYPQEFTVHLWVACKHRQISGFRFTLPETKAGNQHCGFKVNIIKFPFSLIFSQEKEASYDFTDFRMYKLHWSFFSPSRYHYYVILVFFGIAMLLNMVKRILFD